MKMLLLTLGFGLLVASAAVSGGGDFNQPQQQMTQTKVIVVPANNDGGSDWVVPVTVAALGVIGVIGAAYVTRRSRS